MGFPLFLKLADRYRGGRLPSAIAGLLKLAI